MAERSIIVDYSTLHRRVIRLVPVLDKAFRRYKRAVGPRWRMDETCIRVRGQWKYLYRAVDTAGQTLDFLLTARRDADKPDEESITTRQNKYRNTLAEQDHRNIKRPTRPMTGFKSFRRAQTLLAGIERVNMISKGQLHHPADEGLSSAERLSAGCLENRQRRSHHLHAVNAAEPLIPFPAPDSPATWQTHTPRETAHDDEVQASLIPQTDPAVPA